MAFYAYSRFYKGGFQFFGDTSNPMFFFLGLVVAALFIVFIVGFLALLFVRRDLTVAYVDTGDDLNVQGKIPVCAA